MYVIEQHSHMSRVLIEMGLSPERFHHAAVNTGMTNHISGPIKRNKVMLIWSEFPIVRRHVCEEKYPSHITQLCTWARLCHDNDTMFVLFGTLGAKWVLPQLHILQETEIVRSSYHRACAFGIKVDLMQQEPSRLCFRVMSTTGLASDPCRCVQDQDGHVRDWKTKPMPSQDNPFVQAQEKMGEIVAKKLLVRSCLDSTARHSARDSFSPAYRTCSRSQPAGGSARGSPLGGTPDSLGR